MAIQEVNAILGNPDRITINSVTKRKNCVYFTRTKSAMCSEMPYVIFDSTDEVIFSSYGDGG
jgi:hypothetical protein